MSEDEVISEPVRFALLDLAVKNGDFSGAELGGTGEWLLKEIKTTGRSKCSADTTEEPPEPVPSTTPHWRREGPQRQRTESDLRAFQKRVEKRRAKKKRK